MYNNHTTISTRIAMTPRNESHCEAGTAVPQRGLSCLRQFTFWQSVPRLAVTACCAPLRTVSSVLSLFQSSQGDTSTVFYPLLPTNISPRAFDARGVRTPYFFVTGICSVPRMGTMSPSTRNTCTSPISMMAQLRFRSVTSRVSPAGTSTSRMSMVTNLPNLS